MNSTEYELFVQRIIKEVSDRNEETIHDLAHCRIYKGSVREWEVDLSYSFRYMNFSFRVFIECKFWNRPVDINVITHLHECLRDCGAQKGIVATKMGFTEEARRVAHDLNIGLMTIHDEQNIEWSHFDGEQAAMTGTIRPKMEFMDFVETTVGTSGRRIFEIYADQFGISKMEDVSELTPKLIQAMDDYIRLEQVGLPLEVEGLERFTQTYYMLLMLDASSRFSS